MAGVTDSTVEYLSLVGKTPLCPVPSRAYPNDEARRATVLLKMEMQNPGGSVKDRIALNMVEDLEKKGMIKVSSSRWRGCLLFAFMARARAFFAISTRGSEVRNPTGPPPRLLWRRAGYAPPTASTAPFLCGCRA